MGVAAAEADGPGITGIVPGGAEILRRAKQTNTLGSLFLIVQTETHTPPLTLPPFSTSFQLQRFLLRTPSAPSLTSPLIVLHIPNTRRPPSRRSSTLLSLQLHGLSPYSISIHHLAILSVFQDRGPSRSAAFPFRPKHPGRPCFILADDA